MRRCESNKANKANTSHACQQIYVPSWAIEKKYSPGTLVYNWSEEQHNKVTHTIVFLYLYDIYVFYLLYGIQMCQNVLLTMHMQTYRLHRFDDEMQPDLLSFS